MARPTQPSIGNNPNIDINVKRELQKLSSVAFQAQGRADDALMGLTTKLGRNQTDLLHISQFVSNEVQASGRFPINLTGLLNGFTGTIHFAGGFTVDGTTYHNLIFKSGVLTQVT